MKKLLVISTFVLFISMITFQSQASAAFTDVNDRYKESVAHMVEQGYTNGISATQFGTNQSIKRIDAAVIIATMLGFSNTDQLPEAGFTDVPKDRAWAVNALFNEGVVNGKTEKRFGAHDLMTRGEMSKVIASAYQLEAETAAIPFTDVHPRYVPFVAALLEHKITTGKSETSFGTSQNITRGEFSIFIYKGDNGNEGETPNDIKPPEVEIVE